MPWGGFIWHTICASSTGWIIGWGKLNCDCKFSCGGLVWLRQMNMSLIAKLVSRREKKKRGTSEEGTLTHQNFLGCLYIKLILHYEYFNAGYYHCYSSISFIFSSAVASKITTRSSTSKRNSNKGHKNKCLSSNVSVEILIKRVITLCDFYSRRSYLHF